MPFNIFDGLDALVDLLTWDFSKNSSSKSAGSKKSSKKSKYTTELWSGSFLVIASILYFIVFKDPFPEENYIQSVLIVLLSVLLFLLFCFFHFIISDFFILKVFLNLFFLVVR
ncbi:conserved hypothetical protein [Chryseobacterium sp. 8AT]|nr:conserved hypothetical protein [Chryseobacterium sp. 8AT]